MAELLGQLVAVGLGAAISPLATVICIALLRSSKPLETAVAFTLGYAAVLAAISLLAFVFFGAHASSGNRSSEVKNAIDASIGVLFLIFTLKALLRTPDPNAPQVGVGDRSDHTGQGPPGGYGGYTYQPHDPRALRLRPQGDSGV